jgi:glycosyltransferase involved in cell wall biosynthesis
MERVLFLAYLFPPIANSGTQRPLKFAKYLSAYGWEPVVLTAASFDGLPTDHGLLADMGEAVRVIRVPMLNEQIAATVTALAGGGAIGRRLGGAISWRLRNRRRSPDLYALWKPSVRRAAMHLFNRERFDAIYATGFPWTSLVAGAELAKLTRRPLVADFRDLWAGETLFPDDRQSHDAELAMERAVLDDATSVVTASASIARQLAASHPDVDERKFVAIHNGFDRSDLSAEVPARSGRFRIVYTGVWKEGYNPSALYDTIDWVRRSRAGLLDGIEVVAAGFAPGEARRRGLSAVIDERGVVPHDTAVGLMQSADLLFLSHVDPDRQWAVPGKLYEYLASGSPVLAVTHPGRETAQIIESVGGGVVVPPDDPGALFEVLGEACRRRQLVVPRRHEAALAAFERRHLTARLAAVLDDAASRVQVPHTARRIGAGSSVLATRSS